MHSDAFGKIRKKNLFFCNFCEVLEELCKNGRHQQVHCKFLLLMRLLGTRYDPVAHLGIEHRLMMASASVIGPLLVVRVGVYVGAGGGGAPRGVLAIP